MSNKHHDEQNPYDIINNTFTQDKKDLGSERKPHLYDLLYMSTSSVCIAKGKELTISGKDVSSSTLVTV